MLIIIPGNPVPAARPRVTFHGTYNPKQNELRKLSLIIKSQWKCHPLSGPIFLTINFYMPIPKSLSLKKQLALIDTPHTKKPDLDNLLKQTLDASSNIIFNDDSQIYRILSTKTKWLSNL